MQKVRVYQLAKELKVQSALILELLDRLGADVRSDLSVLDSGTADLIRQKVIAALEAEKTRILKEREEAAQQAAAEESAAAATACNLRLATLRAAARAARRSRRPCRRATDRTCPSGTRRTSFSCNRRDTACTAAITFRSENRRGSTSRFFRIS